MKPLYYSFLLLAIMILPFTISATEIIYVTPSGAGLQDGTSWENAIEGTRLKSKLDSAGGTFNFSSPDIDIDFWIAAGTYYPGASADYLASFNLHSGIGLYGGFNGTETSLDQRDINANVTTLSGDLDQSDTRNENDARRVIFASATGYGAGFYFPNTIDGITISGGNEYNIIFDGAQGGSGLALHTNTIGNGTLFYIKNCIIEKNNSSYNVAGVYGKDNVRIENCIFRNNSCSNTSDVISANKNIEIINSIFYDNISSGNSVQVQGYNSLSIYNSSFYVNSNHVISNIYSNLLVKNSIIWSTGSGSTIEEFGALSSDVSYSIVKGGYTGEGNINANPLFVDFNTLKVDSCSPAINAGDSIVAYTTDFLENPRIVGANIDMGAIEDQTPKEKGDPSVFGINEWNVYAWNAGGATNSGSSWNTSYAGYYTVSGLNLFSEAQWNANASPSSATGYMGCVVNSDNHSWSAKRQGFPCGYYSIDVSNQHDGQLLINDVLVADLPCCGFRTDVWRGLLSETDRVEFRVTHGTGNSYGAIQFNSISLPVAPLTGLLGMCGNDQTVIGISPYIDGNYLWSTGDTTPTIIVTDTGTVTLTISKGVGCSFDFSGEVIQSVGDPAVFGDSIWNVYVWNNGGDEDAGNSWSSNYSGYFTSSALNFNTFNHWSDNGTPSSAAGYQGCPVAVDNHSWSAKRRGFACGFYSINIPNHDDEAELWIDGVMVWEHVGCCDGHNNVWSGFLNENSTIEYRVTEGVGGSNGSISINLITPVLTGLNGLCTSNQSIIGISPQVPGTYLWSTGSDSLTTTVTDTGLITLNITTTIGCDIFVSGKVNGVIGDPSVFGNQLWNVYAWNAGGSTNTGNSWNTDYKGYYTVEGLEFNTQNQWNSSTSPSNAVGYQGCTVNNNDHSWSAKRKGFECGYYQINVLNHDDYAELWVNDSLIYPGSDNWKVILDSTSKVEFRVTEGGGSSLGSFNIVPITFDIVASNNFICGIDSVVLTIPLENVSYLWSPGGYTTQHNTIFNAGQYIAAITSQSGCILYDTINIDAVAPPVIGITSDTTICAGTELILTATGAENYIWSPTPIPDIDLNKATLIVGLHKINQDYTGPAIQLRRSTDDALSDFGFIGNDLDTASILSWLNGAEGYCKTLYDQSGNYNHVFQSNYYAQPQFRVSGLNGKPILRYNTNQFMFNSTNFETPYSITYGARLIGSSRYRVLASISNNWLLGFWNGARAKAFFEGWVSSDLNTPIADNKFYIYTGSGNGTTSSIFENGNLLYNNNGGLAGPDGIMLNGWQGGYETSDCEISDVMAFPFELTDEERKSVENITALYYTNTTFGQASIKVKPTSTTIYTVNGKDANGCVGSNSITVSVNAPPQINCPADLNYILETNTCEKVVNYSPATATGNGPFSFSYSINSGSTFNIGTTKVEVVATDALGCSASCSFNITVIDTVSPIIISCPESQSLTDTGSCGELIYFDLPEVLENCPANKTSVRTFNFTGNVQKFIVPGGVNTLKITAIGAKGGNSVNINGGKGASLTGDFNVTPGDTIYLMVGEKGQDNDGIGGGGGGGGTFVSKSANFSANLMLAAGGGGGAGRIGKSDASISENGKRGNNLYYYGGGYEGNNGNGGEATAGGGGAGWLNSGSNNYYFCNNSGTKPSMGGMGGDASYCVSLYSAKGGYGGGGGSAFGGGGGGGYSGGGGGDGFDDTENYYVCGCIDYGYGGGGGSLNNGNNPVNVTGAGTGNGIVTIEFLENFPSITQTAGFKSGSVFPAGTTTNEWTITDASGNTTTCSMDVTVIDVTPPEIICPNNLIVSNDSGQCSAIVYYELPQIIDPCFIDNNNYENMVFLGNFRSSKYYISTNQLTWTAAKSITEGYGGHLVTINSEAEKNYLAAFDQTFWIGLSDAQTEGVFQWVTGEPFVYSNWNDGEPNNSGNEDYIEMYGINGFWNDLPNDLRNYVMEIPVNTNLLQRIAGPPIGSTFSLGTTIITYVASDLSGNKDTCSFTVTVNDTEAPKIINNASNQTAFVNNNCLVAVPDFSIGVLAVDNCNSSEQLSISQSPSIGSTVGRGNNTITISISDTAGNVATSTATFTVLDTIAPQIQCVSNLIVKANEGDTSAIVNFSTPTITDNCDLFVSDSILFTYTGSVQNWIVPQQVTSIKIKAWGAQGGSATNNNNPDAGGKGGYAEGIINTTPGETLQIYVGGAGGPDNTGGFNGGGLGNTYNLNNSSSGGGASDVRKNGNTLNDRVIVAGGGGGAEWGGNCGSNCAGGGLIGLDGLGSYSPAAGFGGTQTAGGAGGQNFCYYPDPFSNPGGFGFGGNAGRSGGGGGGGWYGGGSGGCDGNGGGGSSFIDGLINGNTSTGVRFGNGLIQIEYFFLSTAQQTSGLPSGSNFPIGNSVVEWTATDASNNSSICSQTITVIDTCPGVSISSSISPIICPGESIVLTASNANSYEWSNGATTQSITIYSNPEDAYSTQSFYLKAFTAIGCDTATSEEITVIVLPTQLPVIIGDSVVCNGNEVTLSVSDELSNGLSLNGTSELQGDASLGLSHNGEMTIEFWAQRNNDDAYGAIFASLDEFIVMGFNPFGQFQLSTGDFTLNDPLQRTLLTYNELDNNWHHWAGTISASELKLYKDGNLVATEAVTSPFISGVIDQLAIGSNFSPGFSFDGKIDEMKVWNTVRTQNEIQDHLLRTVPVNTPGLIGYFKFDEGSGNVTQNEVNNSTLSFLDDSGWETPGTSTFALSQQNTYLWSNGATTPSITVNPSNTTQYAVTSTSVSGCNVTSFKTVKVNQNTFANTIVSICPFQVPYNWKGVDYYSSGVYRDTTVNSVGCDSISTLNLTILSGNNDTTVVTACGSYIWSINGQTYSNSGIYSVANACSNSVLILTIKANSSSTTNRIICASALPYTWNGNVYTTAGTYVVTLVNYKGCDSLATLKLNLFPGGPDAVVSVTGATRCDAGTVLLSATPPSGAVIDWYTAASGGSLLASGQNTLTTPVIGATTTYYAQTRVVSSGCTFKTRTPVVATVNTTPSITTTTGASSCSQGSFTLSATPATPSQVVDWYDAASGGNLLTSSSNSYTTPIINTTTTYYAQGRDTVTGCISPSRTGATVTITSSVASATSSNNFRRCTAGSLTINATTTVGNTISWYSDSIGGTLLTNGSSYTTPFISTTTTYYAQVTNTATGCSSPTRTAVQAVIVASQPAPIAIFGSRCGAGTVIISATPSPGSTIDWYAAATLGSPLLSNSTTFTTPVLTANKYYYAGSRDTISGCVSSTRTAVLATINPLGTILSTTPRSRCGSGTVLLTAGTIAGSVVDWFSDSSCTNLLGTTLNFTTPVITGSTTFYARARVTATGCLSSVVPVIATVNPLPLIETITPASRCGTGTVTLSATGESGAVIDWYVSATTTAITFTGGSYTTPSITTTRKYYMQARNTTTGCSSIRDSVTATINAIPANPVATGASTCGAGNVTLTATLPVGSTADWYDAASGGNLLQAGGTSFTTFLNATTTYYVQSRNETTGCISATRVAVVGTLGVAPTAPTTTSASRCGTGTVILAATAPGFSINWYADSVGGVAIATNKTSYTTPVLTTTTTYYVESRNTTTGCVSTTRTPVTATINAIPGLSTAVPGSRCGAGTVAISAIAPSGSTIDWFDVATLGTALQTNSTSFTTPVLSATKNYYASSRDTLTGCVSATRTLVQATVNPLASILSTTPRSRCGTGTVLLTAGTLAGSVLDWFGDSSLTSVLATTANFTTPVLTTTTTFYVRARVTATGCVSAVVPVTATVNSLPQITEVQNGFSCTAGSVLIGATPEVGSTVDWYANLTTPTRLAIGTLQYTTPSISTTTTYYAVARNTTTGCVSAVRSAVLAQINPGSCLNGEEGGKEQVAAQRTVIGTDKVELYPNPTSGNTTIAFTTTEDRKIYLQLYNSIGQLQMEVIESAGAGKNIYPMNLDNFAPGLYILNVTDGKDLSITTKVIKQK